MTDGTAPIDRSPTHIPEAIQVSSLILEYLRRKHQTLRNDYHTPDGIYYESCTELACDVAKLSLKEGIKPSLLSVRGETLPDGVNTKTLVPKLFEGRVTWGGHVVCAKGDIILDPMVGNPMTW